MASVINALNDALNEDKAYLKIALYAIPVYFVTKLFLVGKMSLFIFWGGVVGILLLGLMTQGINNVRMNKREILSLNPITIIIAIIKSSLVLIPQLIIYGLLGKLITSYRFPIDLPHTQLIYSIIVWSILFSIVLTSYMSFSKYLKVLQAYNIKTIGDSCIDVLISFIFFFPQLVIANVVLVGPVAYMYSLFHLPFDHWGFIAYCSAIVVVNVSMLAHYFAQASYEHIKGNNEEYEDNVQINLLTDTPEKFN